MKKLLLTTTLLVSISFSFAQNLTWTTLNTGTTKKINDIYFHSADTGYIVGDDYLFKKTTDGGATWFDLSMPSVGERPTNNGNIIAIDYYEASNFGMLDSGLYLTWEEPFYGVSTDNDGLNYTLFNYPDTNLFCSTSGFSVLPEYGGNGYIQLITYGQNCNGGGVFSNYYDGPFSVSMADTAYAGNAGGFTTVDADSFSTIFGHENGTLLRYEGAFSVPTNFFLDSSGVSAIAYVGNHKWYAATNRSGNRNIYVSIDSGRTFSLDQTFPSAFYYPMINDFSFLTNSVGVAGATYGFAGSVFVIDSIAWQRYQATQPINAVEILEDRTIYAAGDSGLVMKTTLVTSLEEMDKRNTLLKVYPNPVDDYLYLDDLENFSIDLIELLNINGELMQVFPPEKKKLDLSAYPTGAYIIRVLSKREQLSRKVMIR